MPLRCALPNAHRPNVVTAASSASRSRSTVMSNKTSRFLAVAAASLALSLGSAFAAQPPGGPGSPDGMSGHGGPGWHHGHFMKELNQLHGKLKLNADQEKQWQAAL